MYEVGNPIFDEGKPWYSWRFPHIHLSTIGASDCIQYSLYSYSLFCVLYYGCATHHTSHPHPHPHTVQYIIWYYAQRIKWSIVSPTETLHWGGGGGYNNSTFRAIRVFAKSRKKIIISEGYKTPFYPHFSDRTFPIFNRSHGRANNSDLTPPHWNYKRCSPLGRRSFPFLGFFPVNWAPRAAPSGS